VYGPELDQRGPAVAGTRGTPTIDGDRVFLVTGLGKLVTFDAATGQVLRTVDLLERFGAPEAVWELAVAEFPVTVTMDSHGHSLHTEVRRASGDQLQALLRTP
jgi:fumarate hydratase class I